LISFSFAVTWPSNLRTKGVSTFDKRILPITRSRPAVLYWSFLYSLCICNKFQQSLADLHLFWLKEKGAYSGSSRSCMALVYLMGSSWQWWSQQSSGTSWRQPTLGFHRTCKIQLSDYFCTPLYQHKSNLEMAESQEVFKTKMKQESRAVAGNPRDAAVIFDP